MRALPVSDIVTISKAVAANDFKKSRREMIRHWWCYGNGYMNGHGY
jgi:hypothetical protein